jgi:peptidoglycan hydrolase CwlO-like protein
MQLGTFVVKFMKMRQAPFLLLILLTIAGSNSFGNEIAYMQEDRERSIRIELRLEEFQKQSEIQYQAIQKQFDAIQKQFDAIQKQFDAIQKQFDAIQKQFDAIQKQFDGVQKQFDGMQHQFTGLQKQIDTLQNTFFWGIGIMISLIGFLMGFVLWDRRSTLAPLKR